MSDLPANNDDRRSTALAATTIFNGGDDATTCELRQLRKTITAARRRFMGRYDIASRCHVEPDDVPDEYQDADDLHSQYGELLVAFVSRAWELLSPLTRGGHIRLAQVCQVVGRARVAWDETKYLDDAMPIPA